MTKETSIANKKVIREIIEQTSGCRAPSGISYLIFIGVPLLWSLFQLWVTSPLPFMLKMFIFNDTETRSIHLAFAIFLAFIGFPMFRKSPRKYIPLYDWILAFVAAFCAAYLFLFREQLQLATRAGIPTTMDITVACVGILLLLEATRRVMGTPMTVVATIFLIYIFAGPYMPSLISHKGSSLSHAASKLWITTEGVFGVPLGVSASFVFLYVLFGAMLEQSGAGNYLTTLSFSLLGHLRGGPAKAAVVASGLHGLISGSSIANVLTCGPVTIMLMKKVGFSAEKAGAIEVAAGSNGQIMPPVMGAAAFLMIEYINMPYSQLITHAFIPAMLAYGSLLYIVHLEACKLEMKGLTRHTPLKLKLLGWGLSISALLVLMGIIHYLTAWIPVVFKENAWIVFGLLLIAGYVGLLFLSTRFPELPNKPDSDMSKLPGIATTLFSGLHFIMPIAALVWCLMVMEMSPGLAAFYACAIMSFILVTQRPILAWLRKKPVRAEFYSGLSRLKNSLIAGGRNMVGIGLATASAGIIVGTVASTGLGQSLASVVETLSMGYLPLVLIMTALLSIILGMGLPTTANYIIVSTLLAPIIYNLSAANGLAVPLVAVHLFCLYFGVMADATPPVALAAFAASGISGGDPFQTGVQGFIYEMRTAILPFVFLYNPEILLINIVSLPHLIWVIVSASLACMAFASATQRYMLTRICWWEAILLLAAVVFLFRPDLPQGLLYPKYTLLPADMIGESLEKIKPGEAIRIVIQSKSSSGTKVRHMALELSSKAMDLNSEQKLEDIGLLLEQQDDKVAVADILTNSKAEKAGLDIADENIVLGMEEKAVQPAKELFSTPGFLCIAIVYMNQRAKRRAHKARRKKQEMAAA